MIKNIIPAKQTHQLSRSQSPEKKYLTLIDISSQGLLGTGGQNPINAGSSMLTDTPTLEPKIKNLIETHLNGFNYLFLFI